MKNVLAYLTATMMLFALFLLLKDNSSKKQLNEITELRKKHEYFLKNSPFKETLNLTKEQRKAKGIPPNKYMEREWELTMNPAIGMPEPEKLFKLQDEMRSNNAKFIASKLPGEKNNDWVERGPNNVGGRTRAIMFDPNDSPSYNRVFAGGVSGGLWVNDDITDVNSSWSEVNIPQNLAISCITYDPNDTNTFYVGTGESYVQGDANGNGVWKSTDGGVNWTRVFGGVTGETNIISGTPNSSNARLTVNTPAGIAGDYFGARSTFGPSLTYITGDVVLASDGTSPSPYEACGALINGAALNGNIAILNRGTCEFGTKVLNAQNAGAIAVIVVNNVADELFEMGPGADGDLVTIPSMMVTMADGQAIISQIKSGVEVSMNGYRNYSGYTAKPGAQHINDIKVRDIGSGNSEVYVAAGSAFYSEASPSVFLGPEDFGLYKSSDGGSSWSKLTLMPSSNSNDYELQPNDIEIGADNSVWVSTTRDIFGDGGGEILSSSDGVNFTLKHKVPYGERTQIAVSNSDPLTIYVLAELSAATTNGVEIVYTDDAFATYSSKTLPNSKDPDIPDTDFTNTQAFYNLVLEVDPSNHNNVYVGGIDIFRSTNSGGTWLQISEAYTTTNLSKVHPDQHAFVFHPTDSNIAVVGNDGGVYYATGLSNASPSMIAHNNNYNILQFYHGAIGQEVGTEKLLAGSQDNGTQYISNASAGVNSAYSPSGGDGTYVFIDKDNQYFITSSQYGTYYYFNYTTGNYIYTIDSGDQAHQFINPAGLDDTNNYLYSDGSTDSFRINRFKLSSTPGMREADSFTDLSLDSNPTAFKTSSFTSTTLFVGTENGKLFKITNATGVTPVWTEITGNDFIGSISCIELGTSEDQIYVSFHNYGVTNVFYTNNGGTTWQNKEGDLPDIPVKAIMANPLNADEVILGTDLGVWATPNFNDANPNWYQSQNGMKDVKVTSFDLRTSDKTVIASTYGRGVFTGQFTAAPSTLSTENEMFNDAITVYPTVSNGNFNIASNRNLDNGSVRVYNISGKEVYGSKIDFTQRVNSIDIRVSSGLYLVELTSGSLKTTRKIIVN